MIATDRLAKRLFRFLPVRAVAASTALLMGAIVGRTDPYKRIVLYSWVARVSRVPLLQRVADKAVRQLVCGQRVTDAPLVPIFLSSRAARACKDRWLPANGVLDKVFRDIIVLKAPRQDERGVLLLKYTAKFDLFVALFDLARVMDDYYIVLEPCWAGYCDPSILMFLSSRNEVIVQCPEPTDYEFIRGLHRNLVPIELGASDWVDEELFAAGVASRPKKYDLVMVANWAKHKNHQRLFEALSRVRRRPMAVLLVGFEWGGRTEADILREMKAYDLTGIEVEIRQGIPVAEVAACLRQSKVFLLLSEKEGSNKAIVEALFCGVPAIVYENFVGGARSKITAETGILSSFERLPDAIDYMCQHHQTFTPRAWAASHTGSRNATRLLNDLLRSIALRKGERWTVNIAEKVNAPNLTYKHASAIALVEQAPAMLAKYLRDK